jgi:hypothetical protein
MFAGEIRRKRVPSVRQFTHWRWHLDDVSVRITSGGNRRRLNEIGFSSAQESFADDKTA